MFEVRRRPLFAAALALLSACGCTHFTPDHGFGGVAAETRAQLGAELAWPRSRGEDEKVAQQVQRLLGRPLTAEDAVQIALLNNHGLRADFEELKISEADLVEAGRLPNPRFDLRRTSGGGQVDLEETLSFNLLSLLSMPYALAIERQHVEETRQLTVARVADLAARVRESYFRALAARESAAYFAQVHEAADLGALLARRMRAAGNWTLIDAAREQAFYQAAQQALAQAHATETATRESLAALLGLAAGEQATLAQRLPDLPQSLGALPAMEDALLDKRLDLRRARVRIDALARRLKLTRASRFINVLDAGPAAVKQGAGDAHYEWGYSLTLEVPIFDSGAPRLARAEAQYAQAIARFTQAALEARAQIRAAHSEAVASLETARIAREQIVPLRQAIAEEDLRRYNAALVSVFELLEDARGQIGSVNDAIAAARDFWIAKSRLDAALAGASSS